MYYVASMSSSLLDSIRFNGRQKQLRATAATFDAAPLARH